MNKKKIDAMMIAAADILESNKHFILENGKMPKKYLSAISAFGPSIVQTGLRQTLNFYSRNEKPEYQSRFNILQLLLKTLENINYLPDKSPDLDLNGYLKIHWDKAPFHTRIQLKYCFLEACTACKLVLRTYPKKEEEDKHNERF